jgi:adenylate cyclase
MKTGTRLKLKQLGVITLAWVCMGFVIAVYDHLHLHTYYSLGPSPEYTFLASVFRNIIPGLIGALLGGSLLVFFVNEKYRDKPYGYTIAIVCVSFILIVAFITVVMGAILAPGMTGKPLSEQETQTAFLGFITDSFPLKNGLVWFFVVAFTQLMLQVNSKFGHRTFWNIIRGRYNTPKEEKRIFMFLDLNDSTSIAEILGDEAYHALLKDFFADITDPILENKGNIYQYVGDEVVVAWDFDDGLEKEHCLHCFFDIKLAVAKRRDRYQQRFGLVPSFKAGIHSGQVVAGEVGIVKRDITYSGDVLNTTSRILGKCGELKEEIIISSDLLSMLSKLNDFNSKVLGSIKLKGKQHEVLIHALSRMDLKPAPQ